MVSQGVLARLRQGLAWRRWLGIVSIMAMGSLSHGCHKGLAASPQAERVVEDSWSEGKQWFAKGCELYRHGRYRDAIVLIERSLQNYQGLKQYQAFYLVRAYRMAEACEKVIGLATDFENSFPDSLLLEEVLYEKAQCCRDCGQYAQAAETYQRLLERRGQGTGRLQKQGVALAYGDMLVGLGRTEEALAVYRGLREQWPRCPEDRTARARIEEIYSRLPHYKPTTAEDLLGEADLLLAEGEEAKALSLYRTVVQKKPPSSLFVQACCGQIQCLLRRGELEEADALARFLLGTYSEFYQTKTAALLVGKAYWARDKAQEARSILGLLEQPGTPPEVASQAFYIRGRTYLEEGRLGEAVWAFKQARSLYPDTVWGREALWYEGWAAYLARDYETAAAVLGQVLAEGYESSPSRSAMAAYWRAKALEALGRWNESRSLYDEIIREHPESYYRVRAQARLAGDRGLSPALSSFAAEPPYEFPPDFVAAPLECSDQHLSDLLDVGLADEAVRLADHFKTQPSHPCKGASEFIKVYYRACDYPRALTTAQSELARLRRNGGAASEELERGLLVMSYPLLYWDLIRSHAQQAGLDPFLVAALVRQESHFSAASVSQAGAVGLMQLMPSTAAQVALKEGLPAMSPADLKDPQTNLRLGVRHLAELAAKWRYDWARVLAGYNAGPEAVRKWAARRPSAETDEFVESITFPETKDYVKKVLFNWSRYRELYSGSLEERRHAFRGGAGSPLSSLLGPRGVFQVFPESGLRGAGLLNCNASGTTPRLGYLSPFNPN